MMQSDSAMIASGIVRASAAGSTTPANTAIAIVGVKFSG